MNQAGFFSVQFVTTDAEGVTVVAAAYQLATYLAGTSTPVVTYADEDGLTPNANPIELDEQGYCSLFLDVTVKYKFVLLRPLVDGSGEVRVFDNVSPVANAGNVVLSVNGLTGTVVLDAGGIGYIPSSPPGWFDPATAEEGLDQLAQYLGDLDATQILIDDPDDKFVATTVNGALLELAGVNNGGRLLRITTFTATGAGVWTRGTDVGSILVKAVGGGAGGNGGGGGAGGYTEKFVVNPATPVNVTVGGGGAAGAAGGDTTFGTLCSGLGGTVGSSAGGAGGNATGGDINIRGGGGGAARGIPSGDQFGGQGGSSAFGGGGLAGSIGGVGGAGSVNSGGGGGGGTSAHGAGGSGICIVYEYS